MAPIPPIYDRVRELLLYEPDTGLFRWRVNRKGFGGVRAAGSIAGYNAKNGYIELRIDGYMVHAHRLAWFYMRGEWPPEEIDHKNKNRGDTRWENLRLATHGQNGVNKGPNKNNKLCVKGVRQNNGRFEARIWKDGRSIQIGRFSTVEEASAAYVAEARKLHGEFCYASDIHVAGRDARVMVDNSTG